MEKKIIKQLKEKKLKVTPQRIAVIEAVCNTKNHPSADQILESVRVSNPSISIATVYKILDILVASKLLKKIKTEKDVMRYDAVADTHHHLYCSETDRIEDYHNEEIDLIIRNYFEINRISNFDI